jgi:hypothetical protein
MFNGCDPLASIHHTPFASFRASAQLVVMPYPPQPSMAYMSALAVTETANTNSQVTCASLRRHSPRCEGNRSRNVKSMYCKMPRTIWIGFLTGSLLHKLCEGRFKRFAINHDELVLIDYPLLYGTYTVRWMLKPTEIARKDT